MVYESIAHEAKAEWAIYLQAMRARGLIVLVIYKFLNEIFK